MEEEVKEKVMEYQGNDEKFQEYNLKNIKNMQVFNILMLQIEMKANREY